ncbi:APOC3 protein, partial [Pterocles burchelli]|nr:APOC3 protein [Pterocles burchelli]
MKPSLLLLLGCTAILAAHARADTPREPEALVKKVQEYAQKVSAVAKSAIGTVQDSEAMQQARRWLSDNTEMMKERLAWLKERLDELWKQAHPA